MEALSSTLTEPDVSPSSVEDANKDVGKKNIKTSHGQKHEDICLVLNSNEEQVSVQGQDAVSSTPPTPNSHSETDGIKSMYPVLKRLTDEDLRKHGVSRNSTKLQQVCHFCKKYFIYPSLLDRHVRLKVKKHQCKKCEYKASAYFTLNRHIRLIHKG